MAVSGVCSNVSEESSGEVPGKSAGKFIGQDFYQTYARTRIERVFFSSPFFAPNTGKCAENAQKWHLFFFLRESQVAHTSGDIPLKFYPKSRKCCKFQDFGHRERLTWREENLGSTLPGPCPHLPCGMFFEIDSFPPSRVFRNQSEKSSCP